MAIWALPPVHLDKNAHMEELERGCWTQLPIGGPCWVPAWPLWSAQIDHGGILCVHLTQRSSGNPECVSCSGWESEWRSRASFIHGSNGNWGACMSLRSPPKSQLIKKVPDVGQDWGQEKKGMTEDETVGWYLLSMDVSLNKLGDSEGQGSLACYSLWGCQESDMT